ncbi:hypothetical protein AVEN_61200-1 [Araneus ventricosus]|uniref:Uncharacterized protein n=1 Tax=Araneus ventricosus TaxID=182803 RepID=A0A4Y2CTU2_ARAVE|nr:hypothetical protein AVEN_61200-1 [Araneus ventricosus]
MEQSLSYWILLFLHGMNLCLVGFCSYVDQVLCLVGFCCSYMDGLCLVDSAVSFLLFAHGRSHILLDSAVPHGRVSALWILLISRGMASMLWILPQSHGIVSVLCSADLMEWPSVLVDSAVFSHGR